MSWTEVASSAEPVRSASKSLEVTPLNLRRGFLCFRSRSASSPLTAASQLRDGLGETIGGRRGEGSSLLKTWVSEHDGCSMDGIECVSSELTLDLRRFRRSARRIRLAVVWEPELLSESDEDDELELSEELEEFSISANTPGCDSSSIRCCGVLSYM